MPLARDFGHAIAFHVACAGELVERLGTKFVLDGEALGDGVVEGLLLPGSEHVLGHDSSYGATEAGGLSTPTVNVNAFSFSPTTTKSPFLIVPRRISSAIGSSR